MNPAIKALSSIVSAAGSGSAAGITPTRNGMPAHPSRATSEDPTDLLARHRRLRIAQQRLCEFLTETLVSVSVRRRGASALRVRRLRFFAGVVLRNFR